MSPETSSLVGLDGGRPRHVCGDMLNSDSTPNGQHFIRDVHQRTRLSFFVVLQSVVLFSQWSQNTQLLIPAHGHAIPSHLPPTCHELPIFFISSQPLYVPALNHERLPINAFILLITTPVISYTMFEATASSNTAFPVVSCLGQG